MNEEDQGASAVPADRVTDATHGAPSGSPPFGSVPTSAGRTQGRIVGPEPQNEADHFIVCGECGEALDCRNLWAVIHHETPGHAPAGRQ